MVEDRPQSNAFTNTTGTIKMSIDIEKLIQNYEDVLVNYPDYSLVSFNVELAHELKQSVEHAPESNNNAHGNVVGEKTKSQQRKFATICKWVIKK